MSWACVKVDGLGQGIITFADSNLHESDPDWFCVEGRTAVTVARAADYIEDWLYILREKLTKLLP